jgi:hypothetical protein
MIHSSCPDAETVASLAEGGMTVASDREAILRHLAGCEDCYVAFLETVRFVGSLPESGTPTQSAIWRPLAQSELTARPHGRFISTGLAAAAAVVLAAAAAILWQGHSPSATVPRSASLSESRPSASSPATRPPTTPSTVPAWITSAAWRALGDSRHGFVAMGSNRDELIHGMQLASHDAICRRVAPEARQAALWEVAEAMRRVRHLSPEQEQLLKRVSAGDCSASDASYADLGPLVELGRNLEDWRIATLVHDPDAFDPVRAGRVRDLLLLVKLDGQVRVQALSLATRPRAARNAAAWEELQADLQELVDLLCA